MGKFSGVILIAFATALLIYVTIVRNPIIVDIHRDGTGFSDLIVENFPFLDKNRIKWWLSAKTSLNEKHAIIKPMSNGTYTIWVWDYASGYVDKGKNNDQDLLCFHDSGNTERCIEKKILLKVNRDFYQQEHYTIGANEYIYNGDDIIRLTTNK